MGKSVDDGARRCEAVGVAVLPTSPGYVEKLDDRSAAYISRLRPSFDLLRDSTAQLAGLLVLASIDRRGRMLDPPILDLAIDAHRDAEDRLRAVPVPPNAAHHHFHLSLAAERIGEALRIARERSLRSDPASLDRTIRILRAGWEEMLSAAKALPGFQVVDFGRSCCAVHRGGGSSLDAATS